MNSWIRLKRDINSGIRHFMEVVSGLSLGTCTSNLKSVTLTVLELLAFDTQKFSGHVTLVTPLFGEKNLGGHVHTVTVNMHVQFKVCSFNRVGSIGI